MKFRTIIFYFIFIFSSPSIAFSSNIDSLKKVLSSASPKEKCVILNTLCENYLYLNSDSALKFGSLGIAIAKQSGFKIYHAYALNSVGVLFKDKGEYVRALDSFIEAEKLFEEENNNEGKILTALNLGRVYELQGLFEKALSQYTIALSISESIGSKNNLAFTLNHIGSFYYATNEKTKSLEYFKKSLKINQEANNLPNIMESLNNVAVIYQELGNYSEALNNFKTFLNYSQKTEDKKYIVISFHNIALVYKDQKDYPNANSYLDSCIRLATEIKDFDDLREAYSTLSEIYKEQNNFSKALECFQLSVAAKDSLLNQTRANQFIEMSTKYDTEKKEAENKLLKIEGEKQRTVNTAITLGLCLVGALAFFIFRGYRQKQKANILLGAQNTEINEKKNIIEVKQKEILDSISYAKRLQDAILPTNENIKEFFSENFVYYKPKDIVAGDFYWMEVVTGQSGVVSEHLAADRQLKTEDCILIAAADSTGHGVPGAMVSVVCSNALNRSVNEFGLRKTGSILDKTRELVLETFSKGSNDVMDGMDISLLSVNFSAKKIEWSGANNRLWYVTNNKLIELAADKQPIGKTDKTKPFTSHNIDFNKGDMFYLITDGYADQFGGPKGKKFKYKQLAEHILKGSQSSMEEQRTALSQTFDAWKGSHEQVDDVCILGIRI